MEKRELFLYLVTLVSLILFILIVFNFIFQTSNQNKLSLTGNIIVNLEDYKVGDQFKGSLVLNSNELDKYGFLILTKNGDNIIIETFNLNELVKKEDSGDYIILFEDIVDYKFEEKGNYQLLFSIPDSNINIKKDFRVK